MYAFWFLIVAVLLIQNVSNYETNNKARRFPDGLLFGASTSAYQVEGAWNIDGKGENIFDRLVHTKPCFAKDCSNGDVAANSYFLYKRDVQIMRELGLDFYRFSLSWSRILPTGFPNKINKAGVQYYNKIINEMLKYNIEPVITIFHFDLPQKLQDLGGLANPLFIDWFGDFAKIAFSLFGDRVKYWVTINEPYQMCNFGYGQDILAPAINSQGIGVYMCSKNILLAHARAYHIYDEMYKHLYGGFVFISLNCPWFEPASEKESDIEAANDIYQFYFNQYAHPIYSKDGDFPVVLKQKIAAKSFEQGFFRSRLLEFTPEEIDYVRGTSDLFGLNHYSTSYAYRNESVNNESPSFDDDLGVVTFQLSEWIIGNSNHTRYIPRGFYKLLNRIKDEYNNPIIFITESGFASHGGLEDDDRVTYYKEYLNAMLDAIDDGVQIFAYTAWSFIDNFEWGHGYTERFGLYEVDFNSSLPTRTPRKSAYVYKEIIRTHSLDLSYEPDLCFPLTIDEEKEEI